MEPPGEVSSGVARGMVRYKRVGAEGAHEALQTREVSPAGWKDQASVEQLTVKLLSFLKVVCGMR